jgi:hypothetical protein
MVLRGGGHRGGTQGGEPSVARRVLRTCPFYLDTPQRARFSRLSKRARMALGSSGVGAFEPTRHPCAHHHPHRYTTPLAIHIHEGEPFFCVNTMTRPSRDSLIMREMLQSNHGEAKCCG